jgi:hypothetical protein
MRRFLVSFFLAIAVIDLAIAGYCVFLMLWPVRTISIHGDDKILNASKTVYAGQALVYEIDYCKYTTAQAAVARTLAGPVNYPLPASTNNVPPGCRTAISRNTIIPVGVQPGTYHLELQATYRVNPLRSITIRSRSEEFTVVAAPGAPTAPVSNSGVQPVRGTGSATTTSPAPSPGAGGNLQQTPDAQPSLFQSLLSVLRSII